MADTVLVVEDGLTIITSAVVALGATAPKWAQWGVGTTAPDSADDDLETKTGCNETPRTNDDCAVTTTDADDDTISVGALITKTVGPADITEVGLFNAEGAGTPPTGDTLFLRATFSPIGLVAGNSIDFTIDTKFVPV